MFSNLLSFWRGKDFLSQVIDDFSKMLDNAENMHTMVSRALLENDQPANLKDTVYQLDKKINRLERSIRRRIVEHLTLQPTVDTSMCLCLMSVVKDAERIGDYVKNLYEVLGLLEKPIDRSVFDTYFNGMNDNLLTLFKDTKKAFVREDDAKAKATYQLESKLVKECDAILVKLAESELSTNEGVCYTLIARYFKRIAAHLVNISTSVMLPVSQLDYFDEKKAEKTEE
ncbi:MAG: phosphate signaling complex PhoU family protein [Planctomycetota bacterium]|jgi:phosphate uptake regulator